MEYFFYCRDRPGSAALRSELVEAHWTFMDRYAETLIARGPTLTPDGMTATGSLHIVGLPDPAAAREFAFDEPNYRAGVYREVLVRRWRNVLGRTMWQFTGAIAGYQRFLILAQAKPGTAASRDSLDEAHHEYLDRGYRERLIAYGPLFSEDGAEWAGTALLVELPDRAAAESLMADEPYARSGLYENVEIHPWEFGGRR
ncbi:YciI family protein [Actinomadura sp. 1N219]|uniref:YciI family protein n=1 Tax=Actinomadura sp. 1N219 TaxID=3375152 RepID=UPI0037B1D0F0